MKKLITTVCTLLMVLVLGQTALAQEPTQVTDVYATVLEDCEDPMPQKRGEDFYSEEVFEINPREFNLMDYACSLLRQGAVPQIKIEDKSLQVGIYLQNNEEKNVNYDGNVSFAIKKLGQVFVVTDEYIECSIPNNWSNI